MSQEKRDERNKKHREAYKRKNGQHVHIETTNGSIVETLLSNNMDITILLIFLICDVSQLVDGHDTPDKENMDPNETDDWLHRNDSFQGNNIDDISNWLGSSHVINMATMHILIVDRYLVCSGCLAIILTQTQLCRW
jgi:hypothetical protein